MFKEFYTYLCVNNIDDVAAIFCLLLFSFAVSLERWMKNAKKTVWFRVNRTDADWIPHLVKEGFYFHHTKEQIVILYRCLSSEHNIPPYAHTNLGVGSFVINDKTNEILVIKEKYSNPTANALSMWKLPGGYVEPGV